jgi:hypothetical protein
LNPPTADTVKGMQSGVEALRKEDFEKVERVLVVEGRHKTGQTFRQIEETIKGYNPEAQIKHYALVWAPPDPLYPRPELYSYHGKVLAREGLCLPWDQLGRARDSQ